jgi:hypothetical protein
MEPIERKSDWHYPDGDSYRDELHNNQKEKWEYEYEAFLDSEDDADDEIDEEDDEDEWGSYL